MTTYAGKHFELNWAHASAGSIYVSYITPSRSPGPRWSSHAEDVVFIGHRRNNNVWGGGEVLPPPPPLDATKRAKGSKASRGVGGGGTSPPPQTLLLRRWPINTAASACGDHRGPGGEMERVHRPSKYRPIGLPEMMGTLPDQI